MCHCPAASSQNSQAGHQPTACPKQDALLQQTFQLDALPSFYHSGGWKLIITSLFTIPWMLWNTAWIYSIPDAFSCPRRGRIHQEDHTGGSCKAASSTNEQKAFSVQWVHDYKGWQHTALHNAPELWPHQLSQSHCYRCFIQGRQRPTETPEQLLPHAPPFPGHARTANKPGDPAVVKNYHLLLAGPNKLVRTPDIWKPLPAQSSIYLLETLWGKQGSWQNLPHLSPPAERWSARLRCSLGYHVLV